MSRSRLPLLALIATTVGSTSAHALDAAQYVAQVLAEGPASKVSEAEAALTRAEAVGVGRWQNPSLEWQRQSVGGGASNGAQDLFLASVPLVLSGRLGLEADAADTRAEAGDHRLRRARALLHREALDRFQLVLAARARRVVHEESLKVVDQLLEVIAARQKAGEASGYDLLRIQLERSALDTALAQAVLHQKTATREALALLPGTRGDVAFEGELAVTPTAVAIDGLNDRRADLKALGLEEQAADEDRRAAGRGFIPEVVVSGGAMVVGLGQPPVSAGYVVGVSLPLPLFQNRSGERAQADAKKQLARARHALLLHTALAQAEIASSEVTDRAAQLERHRREVLPRAEQLRQVARAAYRGGASELLVLVDAERASRDARLTGIDLQVQLALAHDTLLLLAGHLEGTAR